MYNFISNADDTVYFVGSFAGLESGFVFTTSTLG